MVSQEYFWSPWEYFHGISRVILVILGVLLCMFSFMRLHFDIYVPLTGFKQKTKTPELLKCISIQLVSSTTTTTTTASTTTTNPTTTSTTTTTTTLLLLLLLFLSRYQFKTRTKYVEQFQFCPPQSPILQLLLFCPALQLVKEVRLFS